MTTSSQTVTTPLLRPRRVTIPTTAWPYVGFLGLLVLGGSLKPSLFSSLSLTNTVTFAVILALASAGQTLVIVMGGIDLSLPNTLTISAMTFLSLYGKLGIGGAAIVTVGLGATIGLVNGLGITALKINPIVMTIATNGILLGAILMVFSVQMIGVIPHVLETVTVTRYDVAGLRIAGAVPFGLALLMITQILLTTTGWGRMIYIVGSSADVARYAGIRVAVVKISAYMAAGSLAALAGMVIAGFYQQTGLGLGEPYLLASVAAVVVGGASIFGGRGSIVGTLGGALLLGQVNAVLAVFNISVTYQQIIYGLVIVAMAALYGRGIRG